MASRKKDSAILVDYWSYRLGPINWYTKVSIICWLPYNINVPMEMKPIQRINCTNWWIE